MATVRPDQTAPKIENINYSISAMIQMQFFQLTRRLTQLSKQKPKRQKFNFRNARLNEFLLFANEACGFA